MGRAQHLLGQDRMTAPAEKALTQPCPARGCRGFVSALVASADLLQRDLWAAGRVLLLARRLCWCCPWGAVELHRWSLLQPCRLCLLRPAPCLAAAPGRDQMCPQALPCPPLGFPPSPGMQRSCFAVSPASLQPLPGPTHQLGPPSVQLPPPLLRSCLHSLALPARPLPSPASPALLASAGAASQLCQAPQLISTCLLEPTRSCPLPSQRRRTSAALRSWEGSGGEQETPGAWNRQ